MRRSSSGMSVTFTNSNESDEDTPSAVRDPADPIRREGITRPSHWRPGPPSESSDDSMIPFEVAHSPPK